MNEELFKKTFNEKLGKEVSDPFKLSKICNAAGEQCKDYIREARKLEQPEQKLERSQKQSHGMKR